jgi:hypothetical protein
MLNVLILIRNTFTNGTDLVLGTAFFNDLLYLKQVLRYYIFFLTCMFFIKKSAKLAGKEEAKMWMKKLKTISLVSTIFITGFGIYLIYA